MPKGKDISDLELERGTIRRLHKELQKKGESISYTGLSNRIYRQSHYDTIQRAITISDTIRAEKIRRDEKFAKLIKRRGNA